MNPEAPAAPDDDGTTARRQGLRGSALLGVLAGVAYGLVARWAFDHKDGQPPAWLGQAFAALSIAFLFLVPAALGALAIVFGSARMRASGLAWLVVPWVPTLALVAGMGALAWEGLICLAMALPVFLGMASVGGVVAGLLLHWRAARRRAPTGVAVGFALLPFVFAPVEARLPLPTVERTVMNETIIEASAEQVWSQVVRVPEIRPDEQSSGFFQRIGIPRPREATLSFDGPGALREASFHGGIRFHETITEWQPARRLAFDIVVVPGSVRSNVLDEHVRVGGRHFDVTFGRFVLEPLGPQRVRLRLESRHRLTTRFNAYAGLWTDAMMRDLQVGICRVIKQRSEALAGTE